MNNMKTDKKIYFVHRILSFEKKHTKEELERRKNLPSYIKQKAKAFDKESLELVFQFDNFIKNYKLEKVDLDISTLNEGIKEFVTFIINDRIKKILEYQYIINLKDTYYIIFLPECPSHLVYDKFILFSTTIDNLEKAMIDYFHFIKENKFTQDLILRKEIVTFFKVEPVFDYIRKFIDKFSYSYQQKPYSIVVQNYFGEERQYHSTYILPGETNIYISNEGSHTDLKFLVFIRNFYRNFI